MKKILILLSMLILALFIVGCVEEANEETLEELSDEEFDAVLAEDESPALVGEATKFIAKRPSFSSFYIESCITGTDTLKLIYNTGYVKKVPIQSCAYGRVATRSCNENVQRGYDIRYTSCANGCEAGACCELSLTTTCSNKNTVLNTSTNTCTGETNQVSETCYGGSFGSPRICSEEYTGCIESCTVGEIRYLCLGRPNGYEYAKFECSEPDNGYAGIYWKRLYEYSLSCPAGANCYDRDNRCS
jgi:hypothetical protein